MSLEVFNKSPHTWVYGEANPLAFCRHRLRDSSVIRRLIERCYAPVVIFKPLCDSHAAAELLDTFESAKIIWNYRRYGDTANSAVRKWPGRQKELMLRIVRNEQGFPTWPAEGLSGEDSALVARMCHPDMSDLEAAALMWYLRTKLYFELRLDEDERVLLVQYEDLVTRPEEVFGRVFRFLDLSFDSGHVAEVSDRSVAKDPFPQINSEIKSICDGLLERMNCKYQAGFGAGVSQSAGR